MLKQKESDLVKAVIQYLTLKRIFHYRNNSGAFKTEKGFYRFGAIGSPDIVCVINGQYIGLECKTKTKQSDNQKAFQQQLEQVGGKYLIVRSIDDLINAKI